MFGDVIWKHRIISQRSALLLRHSESFRSSTNFNDASRTRRRQSDHQLFLPGLIAIILVEPISYVRVDDLAPGDGKTLRTKRLLEGLALARAGARRAIIRTVPATQSLRLFVSSTFRDMHAEREELVKRVFPQLRKMCEQRGVAWAEVDLRWGIPDEQKAEGRVLSICLAEIDHCRPYFIAVLGGRYGWIPHHIADELFEEQPWLRAAVGSSVTELEILHGALNDPHAARNAFFYLRSDSYIDSLPADERSDFCEHPLEFEIAEFGEEEAKRRAADRVRKLAVLKERIRTSGLPVRENYADPRHLGELILHDLGDVIEQEFPAEQAIDPLNRERADHETFAASRYRVYIGRPEYFRGLDEYAVASGPPLVILGESGIGKSALLANWVTRWRDAHPAGHTITHFIGATPESTDWATTVRRIAEELKRWFGIRDEIPLQRDKLQSTLEHFLPLVPPDNPIILVIDGLNLLDDRDVALDLVWLPRVIPPQVRLVVSTLPGPTLEELKRRAWPSLSVSELSHGERKQLTEAYLAQYRKVLSDSHLARITAAPQTGSPLYLRALLEELRVGGDHASLDDRISDYLEADTSADLYQRILRRYERDYENDAPGLVRRAMTHIWASRRGLSESELLDLLGDGDRPLPAAYWSPLYLAVEHSIANRGGLFTFFHDYLRDAVRDAYVADTVVERAAHHRLAEYFQSRETSPRKLQEWPWQLARAAEWPRLNDVLRDPEILRLLWNAHEQDVLEFWREIESHSEYRVDDVYQVAVENPEKHATALWPIGRLLMETGRLQESVRVWRLILPLAESIGDVKSTMGALNNLGITMFVLGDLDGALQAYLQLQRLSIDTGDENRLQACAGNLGNVYLERGELDAAMQLYEMQEQICRRLDLKTDMARAIGNQGLIFLARDDLAGALERCEEQARLARAGGDRRSVYVASSNQAIVLMRTGDLENSYRLAHESELYFRSVGNNENLWIALSTEAAILSRTGEFDRARPLYDEAERICARLGNLRRLADFHYRVGLDLMGSYAAGTGWKGGEYTNGQLERSGMIADRILTHQYPEHAIAAFDKAVKLKPDFAEAYYFLGQALEICEQHRGAIEAYEQALRLKPEWPDVQIRLASALLAKEVSDVRFD